MTTWEKGRKGGLARCRHGDTDEGEEGHNREGAMGVTGKEKAHIFSPNFVSAGTETGPGDAYVEKIEGGKPLEKTAF